MGRALPPSFGQNPKEQLLFFVKPSLIVSVLKNNNNVRHQGLLDPNLNVFATTASNATTSSFACYFDKVLSWMVSINDDDNYNGCDVLTMEQILLG